jgi:hypothetical protein
VTEIGFGVFAAVGQLMNVAKMLFARLRKNGDRLGQALRGDRRAEDHELDNNDFKNSKHFLYTRLPPARLKRRRMSAENSTIPILPTIWP